MSAAVPQSASLGRSVGEAAAMRAIWGCRNRPLHRLHPRNPVDMRNKPYTQGSMLAVVNVLELRAALALAEILGLRVLKAGPLDLLASKPLGQQRALAARSRTQWKQVTFTRKHCEHLWTLLLARTCKSERCRGLFCISLSDVRCPKGFTGV